MSDAVPLATGDIDDIERLHAASDHVYLTCPERSGACSYNIEPDRPDDYELSGLLDVPYCSTCGCSLVIVSRGDYDGPESNIRDHDTEGSPLL